MTRLIKYLFMIVAALVVLMLGIAAVVMLLFDPNEYRGEIAALVTEETGREFSIDGDLGLRVLPCCAVSIDDTRLGNPAGFDEPTFASVGSVRLGLQLLPLLFEQRVVVDKISLDGLNVSLLRRTDGAANWEFGGPGDAGASAPEAEAGDTDLTEFSVAGVTISDARVGYRDVAAGTDVIVDELEVRTGPVAAGEPVDLECVVAFAGCCQRSRDHGFA